MRLTGWRRSNSSSNSHSARIIRARNGQGLMPERNEGAGHQRVKVVERLVSRRHTRDGHVPKIIVLEQHIVYEQTDFAFF
jgi:hypothetical protein